MEDEIFADNTVKIAGKDSRIYLGVIIESLQNNDSLILSSSEKHRQKMLYIVQMLEAVGIEVDKDFRNKVTNKAVVHQEIKKNVRIRATGRLQDIEIFKIGIIKIPELFKFTDANKRAAEKDVVAG